jgi:hypothetical protein
MDGEIFNKANFPHNSPNKITFISFPDEDSQLSVSKLENLKINKQISPSEMDFLIRYLCNLTKTNHNGLF